MASRSGTIDSIKVGLGIDVEKANRQIERFRQDVQKEVWVTVKIRKPVLTGDENSGSVQGWLTSLQNQVAGGHAKAIKVPITFDSKKAKADFDKAIDPIRENVQPIIVPVHFEPGEMPRGPGGGGGGGGGTPSGGGGTPSTPTRTSRGGPRSVAPTPPSNTAAGAQQASTALSQPASAPAVPRAARPAQPAAPTVTPPPAQSAPARPIATATPAAAPVATTSGRPATAGRQVNPVFKVVGGGYVDAVTGAPVQNVRGETVRASRDRGLITQEGAQGLRLLHAFEMQDWAAIDAMFPAWKNKKGKGYEGPGVGTALSRGRVGEAETAYLQSFSPGRRTRARRNLRTMGEGATSNIAEMSTIGGAAAAVEAERGGPVLGFESAGWTGGSAQQNPLAFAMSGLLGGVNVRSKAYLKRARGISVYDPYQPGGSPGGAAQTTAQRRRGLERTPVPFAAHRTLETARTVGGIEQSEVDERAAKIAAYQKTMEQAANLSAAVGAGATGSFSTPPPTPTSLADQKASEVAAKAATKAAADSMQKQRADAATLKIRQRMYRGDPLYAAALADAMKPTATHKFGISKEEAHLALTGDSRFAYLSDPGFATAFEKAVTRKKDPLTGPQAFTYLSTTPRYKDFFSGRAMGGSLGRRGYRKLYRGDTSLGGQMGFLRGDTFKDATGGLPEWMRDNPETQAMLAATGRWYTDTPEKAKYYVDHFGIGGEGKVSETWVGPRQFEKFRVRNQPADVRRYSGDWDNEWFVPPHVRDRAKTIKGYAPGGLMDRLLSAKIQKAYDVGDIATGKLLQGRLEQMRGGWTAPAGPASSLSVLGKVAAGAESVTTVGEQGPEAIVKLRGGGSFVVPNHQLGTFKKMTGMAVGGRMPVGEHERNPNVFYQAGSTSPFQWAPFGEVPLGTPAAGRRFQRPSDWMLPAPRGRFAFQGRKGQEIQEYQQGGTIKGFGDIQRVYVVNMPGGGLGRGGGEEGGEGLSISRGGPVRPSAETIARQMQMTGAPGPGGRTGSASMNRNTEAGSMARFQAREAVGDFTSRLGQVGIDISEALQQSPVRALSVAMGQIAQTVVGGRAGILARASGARAAERAAGQAVNEELSARSTIFQAQFERGELRAKVQGGEALTPDEEKRFKTLGTVITEQTKRIDAIQPLIEEQVHLSEALAKGGTVRAGLLSREQLKQFGITQNEGETEEAFGQRQVRVPGILSRRQQIASQAVGLVGIVGGTMLFTAAMGLAQQAIQELGMIANDAGDRLAGFGFTARRQAEEMSQGFAETTSRRAVEAKTLAAIGATSGQVGGIGAVGQQAQIFAGLQGLQQLRDMRRSSQFYEGQGGPGGAIPGLGVGFGNGLFGTFINQQQGASELMASMVRNPIQARNQIEFGLGGGPGSENVIIAGIQDAADSIVGGAQDWLDGGKRNAERDAANQDRASKIEQAAQQAEKAAIASNTDLAKAWNQDIDKWSKFSQQLKPGEWVITDKKDLLDASAAALAQAGVSVSGQAAFRAGNLAFVGRGGVAPTGEMVNEALMANVGARTIPGPNELLTAMGLPLEASMRAQGRQFALQQELIPTSAAEQLIARPYPARAMTGITAREGVDPIAAAAADKYAGALGSARDAMLDIRDQGLAELRSLGVPQEAIDGVTELGDSITRLQSKASDLQLGLEQAQYNEQIRISIRGIGDLLALNGRQAMTIGDQVVAATELGRMQRAQISDSRELANIQLARSQRELNLQVALSRLRSPGETPEERAVRRREAELLAREQQRELDINKRTTQRGFGIQDIEFGRQLGDAVKQLGLLQQSRAVSIEVRGIQQVIEAKQQLLSVRQAYLDVPKQMGIAARQGAIQVAEVIESRVGQMTDASIKALGRYVSGLIRGLGPFLPLLGLASKGPATPQTGSNVMSGRTGAGGRAGTATPQTGSNVEPRGRPVVRERATAGGGSITREELLHPMDFMSGVRADMNGGPRNERRGGDINIRVDVKADVRGEADEDRMARKVARMLHNEVALLVNA